MSGIATVGVVGLGTMGAGIVEVFARAGLRVVATEVDEAALERGRATLARSTDRALARGRLAPADRDALLARISFEVGLAGLAAVDLVIEAVPEHLDLKRRIFTDLDRICQPAAILATNTSALSVTEIAVTTSRPGRVLGMHFFNPAPVMKLVEIVRTVVTAPEVVAEVRDLCGRLGKVGVTIGDRAGFIANSLLFGYLNHAVSMVGNGYVGRDDLDAAMRLGGGLPMGPLALLDLIGLDTAYQILDTMYRHGGRDRRHAPVPLIRQMVTAGLLGRKTGRGFYTYEKPGSGTVVPDDQTPAPITDAAEARPFATVGVVGSGPVVDLLTGAGYDVVVAPDTGTLDRLADADLVVAEAVGGAGSQPALFAALDKVCKPGALLATTSAAVPVLDCAMATGRPADVLGLHVVGTGLVEVVRTIRTSPEAVDRATRLCRTLGRHPVVCGDRAGFVVDALLYPYLNDAVAMVEAAYASADDIDHAMTLGCGYPSGPFAMLDAVGPQTVLTLLRALYRERREPGFAPAPLLVNLVRAGLGFRTRSE